MPPILRPAVQRGAGVGTASQGLNLPPLLPNISDPLAELQGWVNPRDCGFQLRCFALLWPGPSELLGLGAGKGVVPP